MSAQAQTSLIDLIRQLECRFDIAGNPQSSQSVADRSDGSCCTRCVTGNLNTLSLKRDVLPCALPYFDGLVHLDDILEFYLRNFRTKTGIGAWEKCGNCGHGRHYHFPVDNQASNLSHNHSQDAHNPEEVLTELFGDIHHGENEIEETDEGDDFSTGAHVDDKDAHLSELVMPMPIFLYYLIRSGKILELLEDLEAYSTAVERKTDAAQSYALRRLIQDLKRVTSQILPRNDNSTCHEPEPDSHRAEIVKGNADFKRVGYVVRFKLQKSVSTIMARNDGALVSWQLAEIASVCTRDQDTKKKYSELRDFLRILANTSSEEANSTEGPEAAFQRRFRLVVLSNRGRIGRGKFGTVYEVGFRGYTMALKVMKDKDPTRHFQGFQELVAMTTMQAGGKHNADNIQIQNQNSDYGTADLTDVEQWSNVLRYAITQLTFSYWAHTDDSAGFIESHQLLTVRYPTHLEGYLGTRNLPADASLKQQLRYRMEAAYLIYQLANELAPFHSPFGLMHGDLHPRNVLVYDDNSDLEAALCDFGLSRHNTVSFDAEDSRNVTSAATSTSSSESDSTPYVSSREAGPHSDIRALGTFYSNLLKGIDYGDPSCVAADRRYHQISPIGVLSRGNPKRIQVMQSRSEDDLWLQMEICDFELQRKLITKMKNAEVKPSLKPFGLWKESTITAFDVIRDLMKVFENLFCFLRMCQNGEGYEHSLPSGLRLLGEFCDTAFWSIDCALREATFLRCELEFVHNHIYDIASKNHVERCIASLKAIEGIVADLLTGNEGRFNAKRIRGIVSSCCTLETLLEPVASEGLLSLPSHEVAIEPLKILFQSALEALPCRTPHLAYKLETEDLVDMPGVRRELSFLIPSSIELIDKIQKLKNEQYQYLQLLRESNSTRVASAVGVIYWLRDNCILERQSVPGERHFLSFRLSEVPEVIAAQRCALAILQKAKKITGNSEAIHVATEELKRVCCIATASFSLEVAATCNRLMDIGHRVFKACDETDQKWCLPAKGGSNDSFTVAYNICMSFLHQSAEQNIPAIPITPQTLVQVESMLVQLINALHLSVLPFYGLSIGDGDSVVCIEVCLLD